MRSVSTPSPLVIPSVATTVAAHASAIQATFRLDYIDSLRGIAALLVIWLHVSEVFVRLSTSGAWLYDAAWAINSGRVGVVLFFAISGFVIPSSLRSTAPGGAREALRAFLIHRFFRLFPVYWVSVLAACMLGWTLMQPFSVSTALMNLTMVQTVFGFPDVIGLYWTLRIELVFYALCAGLFVIGGLHWPAWLAAGVVAGLLCYVGGHALRRLIPSETWPEDLVQFPSYALFLAFMFWGALFRRWHDGRLHFAPTASAAVLVLFPLLVCTAPPLIALLNFWRPTRLGDTVAHALGLGTFILCTTCWRLRGPVGAWLGEISYSLYLFHPIVFYVLFELVRQGRVPALAGLHVGTYVFLSVLLTIGVASATYYGIERPAIRLGRRMAPGRTAAKTAL